METGSATIENCILDHDPFGYAMLKKSALGASAIIFSISVRLRFCHILCSPEDRLELAGINAAQDAHGHDGCGE
jgi:hypothetical protein